jgi:hypothetical protein
MRLPDDPLNPKPPPKRRTPQYVPIPDSEKKVSGRPRKYDRVLVEAGDGKQEVILVEVDKRRFWFVSYNYVLFDVTRHGSITFETRKNMIFSMYDLGNLVGNRNLNIVWWKEFDNAAEYKEFSRREPLVAEGMNVLQV